MRAMVLDKPKRPLKLRDVPDPRPGRGQLLVRISACAVCRTDLHVVDGELPDPKLPLILGHQIVGRVEEIGEEANSKFRIGDRFDGTRLHSFRIVRDHMRSFAQKLFDHLNCYR